MTPSYTFLIKHLLADCLESVQGVETYKFPVLRINCFYNVKSNLLAVATEYMQALMPELYGLGRARFMSFCTWIPFEFSWELTCHMHSDVILILPLSKQVYHPENSLIMYA